MPSTEFIVHAGTYKTATSTLQTLLSQHRDAFFKKYGLWYPRTGARRNTGSSHPHSQAHHLYYHAVRKTEDGPKNPDKAGVLSSRLAEEIADIGTSKVLICTELLSSARLSAKADFLKMLGPDARVRVVYAVRRPDEYLESILNQGRKNFKNPTPQFDRALPMISDIEEWQTLVGKENLSILTFTKEDYSGYLRRSFASLGIDQDDPLIDTTLHDNPATTLRGLMIRTMIRDRMAAQDLPMTRERQHRINVELDGLESGLTKSPKASFLSEDMRRQCLATNAEAMTQICAAMSDQEAARLKAELARPVNASAPNASTLITMEAHELEKICELLSTGYLGRLLSFGAAESKRTKPASRKARARRAAALKRS